DFTLRLLRRGTRKRSADALDDAIERVGGSLEAGSFEDFSFLGLTVPVPHLLGLIDVLAEMIHSPAFPVREVRSARARTLGELRNDLDDPGAVADRALLPALWGKHPYGHDVAGGVRSVSRFDRPKIARLEQERFVPKSLSLYVVGPVEADEIQ